MASLALRSVVALAAACSLLPPVLSAQRRAPRLQPTRTEVDFPVDPPSQAIANAPVAPDAIYVARGGSRAGISVLDLNGFGASTGNPTFDPLFGPGSEGNSNFPWNPNVSLQGSLLVPPLSAGSSARDGGSAGVFTLTKDSSLDDLLVETPTVSSVGDMMLGHPLDKVFNNGSPFGCQAGGGNLCALTGLATLAVTFGGPNTLALASPLAPPFFERRFESNTISFAPHPNPPPVIDPPLCEDPLLRGQEPTTFSNGVFPLTNLLAPGPFPLGIPELGLPPQGLLASEQNAFFSGPSPPQATPLACREFTTRQQIGHFLYVVDALAQEIVVLNSNTFRVLERIQVPRPVELAMDPNLRFLAVTSRARDQLVFVGIDPASVNFHSVVKSVAVGRLPSGVAWDGAGEDILVCNEGDGTVSIVSGSTLEVRKTVDSRLRRPFGVAIVQRQDAYGSRRNVYYAAFLDREGHVSLFESGPTGPNGWGYDDVVAIAPFVFKRPKAIQPDPLRVTPGFWIVHEGSLNPDGSPAVVGGAVSLLVLDELVSGMIPVVSGSTPHLRSAEFRIAASIGADVLSGIPVDLAFDDLRNLGALPGRTNPFSPASGSINGKSLVRDLPDAGSGSVTRRTNSPSYLVLAVPGAQGGVLDVVDLETRQRVDTNAFRPGVQSIPAVGVTGLASYFRQ